MPFYDFIDEQSISADGLFNQTRPANSYALQLDTIAEGTAEDGLNNGVFLSIESLPNNQYDDLPSIYIIAGDGTKLTNLIFPEGLDKTAIEKRIFDRTSYVNITSLVLNSK